MSNNTSENRNRIECLSCEEELKCDAIQNKVDFLTKGKVYLARCKECDDEFFTYVSEVNVQFCVSKYDWDEELTEEEFNAINDFNEAEQWICKIKCPFCDNVHINEFDALRPGEAEDGISDGGGYECCCAQCKKPFYVSTSVDFTFESGDVQNYMTTEECFNFLDEKFGIGDPLVTFVNKLLTITVASSDGQIVTASQDACYSDNPWDSAVRNVTEKFIDNHLLMLSKQQLA